VDLEVVLPDESLAMAPETLVALAEEAERLGYRTAYLPDHLLPPAPYGDTYGGVYEPLVTLAHLAALTSTIRLGTSVLVLPMRSPFVVAKQVATLDRLSGGRAVLGVGVGWDAEEFGAVGADFATRGARTDEDIRLLRHLFRGGGPFRGRFHDVPQGVFAPVPERPVPIMVGGSSGAALRRTAELADEWQGVGLAPGDFADRVARLRALTDRPIRLGSRIAWRGGRAGLGAAVREAHALADAGADAVAVWFGEVDGAAERMAEFAAAVRA
jgi:probable F420-dependent oxidoreductase